MAHASGYERVFPLGEGGMGVVWLARTPEGVPVAVKTLRPELATDARVRSMFLKELRLVSSIRHPNVVSVLASGEEHGLPYFVMEWVNGRSVRGLAPRVAPRGGFPLAIALRIALDACAGLHAAHELRSADGAPLGLVHRDVTPHNLVVSACGMTKVIDFGIAKARELGPGETTSSGGIKGKVRYMAPEQALARPVDRRADVFALGAVLFELVVGRAAFEGPNDLAILRTLLATRTVDVPSWVPVPIADVLVQALARRREDRFASCDEFGAALTRASIELGLGAGHADVAAWLAAAEPDLDADARLAWERPAASYAGPHEATLPDAVPGAVVTVTPRPVGRGGRFVRAALLAAASATCLVVLGTAVSSARVPPAMASERRAMPVAAPAAEPSSSPMIVLGDEPKPNVAPTASIAKAPAARVAERAAPPRATVAAARRITRVDPYDGARDEGDLESALRERH